MDLTGRYFIDERSGRRCRVLGYIEDNAHWRCASLELPEVVSERPHPWGVVTVTDHPAAFEAHEDWVRRGIELWERLDNDQRYMASPRERLAALGIEYQGPERITKRVFKAPEQGPER